jgi:isopentenyl diphosphate isomerase/L-lactate dehydrogenase-like FMN-dependent dehydrogenase
VLLHRHSDATRGARGVIDVFRNELDMAMALSGRPTIDSVGRDLRFPDP